MTRILLKPVLSILCTAALYSYAGAQTAPITVETDTVTVQQGDTAYSLSRRAGLSVADLLRLNNLDAPTLKIGQVVVLRAAPVHVVQGGETLYALSRQYGVTVDALRVANDLPIDATISIGQSLRVPAASLMAQGPVNQGAPKQGPVSRPESPGATVAAEMASEPGLNGGAELPLGQSSNWRNTALALMNTPYVWGGQNRAGTDCSGFVLQVFAPLGVRLPRQSADQARAGVSVSINELQAGDLLFFDTAGSGRVTHVGIYMGNDTFINANSYRGKVTLDHLRSDKYWATRYLSARRVLPDALMAN